MMDTTQINQAAQQAQLTAEALEKTVGTPSEILVQFELLRMIVRRLDDVVTLQQHIATLQQQIDDLLRRILRLSLDEQEEQEEQTP